MIEEVRGPVIKTKCLAPTSYKGTRVKASIKIGSEKRRSAVIDWDYSSNTEENHRQAALALCERLSKSDNRFSYNLYDLIAWDDDGYIFVSNIVYRVEQVA
jgi:hypothetical protein